MQFQTVLRARVPCCKCENCSALNTTLSWAGNNSLFIWIFDAFAVTVLQSTASTEDACALRGLGWEAAQRLMVRGVDHSSLADFEHAGIAEKNFGSGQVYTVTLNDLQAGAARVIEVMRGRGCADASGCWSTSPLCIA